ncbi:Transcriptional repressor nrdR [Desulfotomaculum nigrificans CO-1-SRB]|uniref:Transcriptional repressor NrdR n=1 Tax=Desulfotomaculum nigrificans (strain DSM 14880 / VKM B-2319 / CO-1-SRB) TaxID=868595 RepID=F6B3C6_DESCC|nr:transcriptional regulator NrdR [Desulfotomaculum nigrificans]AEF95157.1 Transcriptional repressor nrdR [Desulfotomaculum nigrificans CO-1-SRB]
MRCPFCSFSESRVLDSRPADDGNSIRRRRECGECGKRFTTYERVEERPLVIVKKDGRREVFDRAKLLAGLIKACEKRPVPVQELEKTVSYIERELRNNMELEVPSQEIGEMVMDRLRELDEVAYVRFASVYRQFRDVYSFLQEVEQLLKSKSS